jgi:hypothetical protein
VCAEESEARLDGAAGLVVKTVQKSRIRMQDGDGQCLDQLVPYARNARTHSQPQIAQVAASIAEFGFTNPLLIDSHAGIIAGH